MNKTPENIDDLLKDYFSKIKPDQPGNDFTGNIMNRISLSADTSPAPQSSLVEKFNIFIIGIIILASLVVAYFISSYYGFTFLPKNTEWNPVLVPVFENIYQYLKQIFTSISISPVTLVIILGVLLMIVLDRFIRFIPSMKNMRMSL